MLISTRETGHALRLNMGRKHLKTTWSSGFALALLLMYGLKGLGLEERRCSGIYQMLLSCALALQVS